MNMTILKKVLVSFAIAMLFAINLVFSAKAGNELLAINPPTVQTNAATSITTSGAVLNANATLNGGTAITDCGFYWGTSSTSQPNKLSYGAITGTNPPFSKTISGLNEGVTYYFKAYGS